MLSTAILDVAIGLIFTFLAVSLAAGAVVEAGASLFKLRSTTLKAGLMQLLNDPDFDRLAAKLYDHAMVNPRGPGASAQPSAAGQPRVHAPPAAPARSMLGRMAAGIWWHLRTGTTEILPAYIDPQQFASAVIDVMSLVPAGTADTKAMNVNELIAAVDAWFPRGQENPQIQQLLHGIIRRACGDITQIHRELAGWFDNAMDRVSGVYKRYTQVIGFVAALAITAAFNADALQVAQRLWAEPVLVADLKDAATVPSLDKWQLVESLPVGWAQPPTAMHSWFSTIAGWLVTAIASLFGAPFWFGALQRVTRLKGSGPGPADKTTTAA